ncbi:unnamed protein product, partial [Rotaria sp. Silwood1]
MSADQLGESKDEHNSHVA